ncbi:unnamed protein product [Fusarium langsethiae]|nr:unnamed protein product [Fusarium langsethiae]
MGYYRRFTYRHWEKRTYIDGISAYLQLGDGKIFTTQNTSPQQSKLLSMFQELDFQPFDPEYYGPQWTMFGNNHHISVEFSPPRQWPRELRLSSSLTRIAAQFPATKPFDKVVVSMYNGSTWSQLGLAQKTTTRYPIPEQEWVFDILYRDPRQLIAFEPFRNDVATGESAITCPLEICLLHPTQKSDMGQTSFVAINSPHRAKSDMDLQDTAVSMGLSNTHWQAIEDQRITDIILSQKDVWWHNIMGWFPNKKLQLIREMVEVKTKLLNQTGTLREIVIYRWSKADDEKLCTLVDRGHDLPTILNMIPYYTSEILSTEFSLLSVKRSMPDTVLMSAMRKLVMTNRPVLWMKIRHRFPGIRYPKFKSAWRTAIKRFREIGTEPTSSFVWDGVISTGAMAKHYKQHVRGPAIG